MSASREKQKRTEIREGGLEPIKRKATPKSDTSRKLTVSVIATILVLLVVVFFVYASGTLHKNVAVLTVGGTRVTPAEYNYHYVSQTWNTYNMYYNYFGSAVFDPSQKLSEQEYSEDTSWADYINQATTETLTTILKQYNLAVQNGTQLTEEDRTSIDDSMKALQSNASSQGMTIQRYLDAVYGQGITADKLRTYMERALLASRWEQDKRATFTYNDADLEAYYAEHRTDFDRVTYESHTFDGVLTEGSDEQKAAFYNEVKALADEMLNSVTTPESFNAKAAEYKVRYDAIAAQYAPVVEDEDASGEEAADEESEEELPVVVTLREDTKYSSVSDETAKTWLFDGARVKGDKTSLESDDQKITLYSFINKSRDETPATYDVRHILASFESEDPTEEQKEAAKTRAEDILQRWKDGPATEESFGELANAESDDQSGNVTDGGIYEDLTSSTNFVAPFKEWYLDPVRKPGDTGIIETEYGYHVMYFIKSEGIGWSDQAKSTMVNAAYSASFEEATKDMKVVEGAFGKYLTNIGK